MSKEIKGISMEERNNNQISEWVNGNPIHNKTDGQCCPDFSCCKPHLLADKDVRIKFKEANDSDRFGMLTYFLSALIASETPEEKVHIAGEIQQ